jgi:hypothetical protein
MEAPMITHDDLANVLLGLQTLHRFAKRLEPEDLQFAYLTLPPCARQELTPELLVFASQQLLLDPEPAAAMAPHLALLRYLYPCSTGRDPDTKGVVVKTPEPAKGLRFDLPQRLANPDSFHPLWVPFEQRQPALPPAPDRPTPQPSRAQRIERLERLAAATGVTNPRLPAHQELAAA